MSTRSPKYGLTGRTRKPVTIACNDLSQAINTLEAHHHEEAGVFQDAMAAVIGKLDGKDERRDRAVTERARLIGVQAEKLRDERAALLERLLALRAPLVDVLFEAHGLLPGDAMFSAHVEPHLVQPAPVPAGGIDVGLTDRLYILGETLRWSREISNDHAVLAQGPCYLLSYVIEHPAEEARAIRAELEQSRKHLLRFVCGAYR